MALIKRRYSALLLICLSLAFAYIQLGEFPHVDTGQNDVDHTKQSSPIVTTAVDSGTLRNVQVDRDDERYLLMHQYSKEAQPTGQVKRILFWNEAYGSKNYEIGIGHDVFEKAGCPTWQCETTDNRDNVDQFDAIVFHLRSWTRNDLPRRRSPHQRYVFWSMESPAWRYVDTDQMAGFFNWTMTYRWDSDAARPYGWIEPTTGSVPLHPDEATLGQLIGERRRTGKNYAAGKTKTAAWFVSNCASFSGRGEFVEHLQRYVDVDVYGDCGTKICPRKREQDCREMAARKYKFYLSFENSLCRDYITEKFFSMMRHDIVPVVIDPLGDHERIAPPHSFINAANFKSVMHLANYLELLSANDTLYNEYFWWKPYYTVRNSDKDGLLAMCHLCAALHNASLPVKVYDDMTAWWQKRSKCVSAQFH